MSNTHKVETGSGLGYHKSRDVYDKDNNKLYSEVERSTITGKEYIDILDSNGDKVDSYWK